MRKAGQRKATRSAVAGFLMIEILVALAIFSVSLVGLTTMLTASTRQSIAAEERLRASVLASDIVSVIWVEQPENADDEIQAWSQLVAADLPDGVGEVVINGNTVQVNISWFPVWASDGDQRRQYSTTVSVF